MKVCQGDGDGCAQQDRQHSTPMALRFAGKMLLGWDFNFIFMLLYSHEVGAGCIFRHYEEADVEANVSE